MGTGYKKQMAAVAIVGLVGGCSELTTSPLDPAASEAVAVNGIATEAGIGRLRAPRRGSAGLLLQRLFRQSLRTIGEERGEEVAREIRAAVGTLQGEVRRAVEAENREVAREARRGVQMEMARIIVETQGIEAVERSIASLAERVGQLSGRLDAVPPDVRSRAGAESWLERMRERHDNARAALAGGDAARALVTAAEAIRTGPGSGRPGGRAGMRARGGAAAGNPRVERLGRIARGDTEALRRESRRFSRFRASVADAPRQ